MRTSLDLPDELLKEAKIVAVQRGITLRTLMTTALEKELSASGKKKEAKKWIQFPLIRTGSSNPRPILSEDIKSSEAEDDLKRSGLNL